MARFSSLLAACLVAPLALASPYVFRPDGKAVGSGAKIVRNVPEPVGQRDGRLVSREPGAPMVRRNGLVARTDTRAVSLEQTLENEPLFNSSDISLFTGPSIEVVCTRCCSKGRVEATFPSDLDDIVNPKFRVDLVGVEALIELDVVVSAESNFQVPLLKLPPGLTNIELPGFKAGLFIDLVLLFELSAEVDLSGGFYLKIPDGSFFEIDITAEGLHSEDFTGVVSKPLPITINKNNTQVDIKVDLQLKASLGISGGTDQGVSVPGLGEVGIPFVDLPNIGAGAEVGAFINIVEFIGSVAPTNSCALEAVPEINVNIGTFAQVGVSFLDDFVGLEPSATTTLFVLPLPTACIVPLGQSAPVRSLPLPTERQCVATPAASNVLAIGSGSSRTLTAGEPVTTIHITRTSTLQRTVHAYETEAPRLVGRTLGAEGVITQLTAVACATAAAVCPTELRTTVTYEATVCPPAVTQARGCFASITDASTFAPTSVVNVNTGEQQPAGTTVADASETVDPTSVITAAVPPPLGLSTITRGLPGQQSVEAPAPPLGLSTLTVVPGVIPTPGNAAQVSGTNAVLAPAVSTPAPPLGFSTITVVPEGGNAAQASGSSAVLVPSDSAPAPPLGLSTLTVVPSGVPTSEKAAQFSASSIVFAPSVSAPAPPLGFSTLTVVPGVVPVVENAAQVSDSAPAPPLGLSTVTTLAGPVASAGSQGAAAQESPVQVASAPRVGGSLLGLAAALAAVVVI